MNKDDPHTRNYPEGQLPAWRVVYWNGNTASGSVGADRASLEQFIPGMGFYGVGNFQFPDDGPRLAAWLRALELAHAAGKKQMKQDFRAINAP
jgi:hypothetical protein